MTIDSLTYVVPTYRTAGTLAELVDRIEATATACADRFEIIVVDDACPERSGRTVAGRAGVRVYGLDTNHGQRTAALVGMSAAASGFVCVLDADLQDDPAEVGTLLAGLDRDGADVVCAGRRGAHESAVRRGQAWAFRRTRWLATGGAVPPDAGLFHVARAGAVHDMLAQAAPGDDPLVVYARSGARITSVPVARRPRPVGRSAFTTATRAAMAGATARTLVPTARRSAAWPALHPITTSDDLRSEHG